TPYTPPTPSPPTLFNPPHHDLAPHPTPDKNPPRKPIARTTAAPRLNKQLDTDFAVVWPGIDGYELGFGLDFAAARARFAEGLAEAMDQAPGVRIAFEPKPYEPRGHILYGTTPEGILLGRDVEAMLRAPAN